MATPLINGKNYSWASINFVLFGVPVAGIAAIDYNRKQEKVNNYGIGVEPVSVGYGNVTYEGSIELYLDEWKRIIAASPDRNPLNIPYFDIPIIYGDSMANLTSDVLRAVEFMEDPFSAKQGDTKLTVKIPLRIGGIDR